MELSKSERDALVAWMKDKNLTQHDVAKMFNVTYVSVMKWLSGGGLARLRKIVAPYIKLDLDSQPEIELKVLRSKLEKHIDTHPELVSMHLACLDQLEGFLARQQK